MTAERWETDQRDWAEAALITKRTTAAATCLQRVARGMLARRGVGSMRASALAVACAPAKEQLPQKKSSTKCNGTTGKSDEELLAEAIAKANTERLSQVPCDQARVRTVEDKQPRSRRHKARQVAVLNEAIASTTNQIESKEQDLAELLAKLAKAKEDLAADQEALAADKALRLNLVKNCKDEQFENGKAAG